MTQGSEKKSRGRIAFTFILYFIVVVIISGIIYVALEEDETGSKDQTDIKNELIYIPEPEYESFMFELNIQDASKHALDKSNVSIYKEVNETLEFLIGVTLSEVKTHPQITSFNESIIYYDFDTDDIVSKGDLILIWIDPLTPGNYTMKMSSFDDDPIASVAFIVQ
jgi:hypothetical protein